MKLTDKISWLMGVSKRVCFSSRTNGCDAPLTERDKRLVSQRERLVRTLKIVLFAKSLIC